MSSPQLSARYLQWLHDYLRRAGVDPSAALGPLPPASTPFLPMAQWRAHLDAAAAALHDEHLGVHFGLTIGPQRFGVPGFLLYHCDNFGQALRRTLHFRELFFHLHRSTLQLTGSDATIAWRADVESHYLEESFEVVASVQFGRLITGQRLVPTAVGLMCAAPADAGPLQEFLGCPLHFGEGETWVRQPLAYLAQPTAQPDATMRALLETQAEAMLASLPGQDPLLQAVRRQIVALLPQGEPTLERVAQRLQTSSRTLHRRLADRGCRFRDVLDESRRQLAESYLRDPQLALADIALLLGYAEQSPFTHAFRRWAGVTPSAWRRVQCDGFMPPGGSGATRRGPS